MPGQPAIAMPQWGAEFLPPEQLSVAICGSVLKAWRARPGAKGEVYRVVTHGGHRKRSTIAATSSFLLGDRRLGAQPQTDQHGGDVWEPESSKVLSFSGSQTSSLAQAQERGNHTQ